MKRKIAIALLAVMLLTLVACQRAPKGSDILTVEKDGKKLFVIFKYEEQTISVGETLSTVYGPDGELIWEQDRKDRYQYQYDDGNITITYPNGATYWESATTTGAVIGWDDDYDPERYIDGDILARQLTQAYQYSRKNWDPVLVVGFFSLIIIVLSILDIMHPDVLHKMRYGLWVQNAEPTEFALMMSRICGIVAIVFAVIMFLVAFFS